MMEITGTTRSFDRGMKSTVDWKIVFCYLALVLFGWLNVYAATQSSSPSSIFDLSCNCGKQIVWIGTALVIAAVILFAVNPKFWEAMSIPGYFVVLILLVAVIFLSRDIKGSHSWFSLGPVSFQPAEISKITTSLMLAWIMSKTDFRITRLGGFLKVAFCLAVPMLAILAENETGSMLVYVGFLFLLYREGLSGWYIFYLAAAIFIFILTLKTSWLVSLIVVGVCCLVYLIYVLRHTSAYSRSRRMGFRILVLSLIAGVLLVFGTGVFFNDILQDHQRDRIQVLLGIREDLKGAGYNVHQSMIAIGSGGFFGKGFLGGTQTAYGFVPEQSTDFIFCTVGEEWGFLGCLFVIGLYVFMIYRIVTDADKCRSSFARIYGFGLASCLFMHLFINVGMTIGLMPVIGIPLPLISYGGSSLWTFTTMIFIFVAMQRQDSKYF